MVAFYGYMADIEEVSRMGNEREDARILLQTVGSKVRKSPSIQKNPKTSPKEKKEFLFYQHTRTFTISEKGICVFDKLLNETDKQPHNNPLFYLGKCKQHEKHLTELNIYFILDEDVWGVKLTKMQSI